jgi:hypothetical protein
MLKINAYHDGKVCRTRANLDVSILRDWQAARASRRPRQLFFSMAVGIAVFTICGALTSDSGARFFMTIILSVGSYILVDRLFDYYANYHKCGQKLQLLDVHIQTGDRAIVSSKTELLHLNEDCTIAEVLECIACDTFCYIRTHDGV